MSKMIIEERVTVSTPLMGTIFRKCGFQPPSKLRIQHKKINTNPLMIPITETIITLAGKSGEITTFRTLIHIAKSTLSTRFKVIKAQVVIQLFTVVQYIIIREQ